MEFEFERRRLTKEDIRELIYREILEYHPQLLKDYMSGSEGSSFVYPRFVFLPILLTIIRQMKHSSFLSLLSAVFIHFAEFFDYFHCSAIGHLRKQFTYLEENSSRNGPVIPLERKHASLPRYVFSFHPCQLSENMLSLLFFLLLLHTICRACLSFICSLPLIFSTGLQFTPL